MQVSCLTQYACLSGTYFAGAGGSHGGEGGDGDNNVNSGPTYDSILSPSEFGEAGGCGHYDCSNGGAPAGGGALLMQTSYLENHGVITAR